MNLGPLLETLCKEFTGICQKSYKQIMQSFQEKKKPHSFTLTDSTKSALARLLKFDVSVFTYSNAVTYQNILNKSFFYTNS